MIRSDEHDYVIINCDACKKSSWRKRNGASFKTAVRHLMGEGWRPEKINGKWHHFCSLQCYFDGLKSLLQEAANA